jgi:hypothetical protein
MQGKPRGAFAPQSGTEGVAEGLKLLETARAANTSTPILASVSRGNVFVDEERAYVNSYKKGFVCA